MRKDTMAQTRRIPTDGLEQQVLEAGTGPLVLLIHGFPELAISWRAQVAALAAAGFHAVAPDMRGYGGTGGPSRTEDHTILHLVGDMVDLVRALGRDRCVVVGHDWGAPVAWHCALMRPDLFTAVAGLSMPFQPRTRGGPPIAAMRRIGQKLGADLYIAAFQHPEAHAAYDDDPATALRKCFWSYDGATPAADRSTGFLPPGVPMLDTISDRAALPPWLSEAHFQEYVAAFTAGGFKRPFDWYRNLDRNWDLTAWLQDARIRVPALFVVGEHDPVRHYAGRHEATLKDWAPDLRGPHVLPGAGHWLQQERPEEVNRLLLEFLRSL
jgi:pimeloyl-ACP methyl ester carboxylesterase